MSLEWRDATRDDAPHIERLWVEQQKRLEQFCPSVRSEQPELFCSDGERSPVWPFKPPVLRVRVAEQDGAIVAARVVEAVCEVQLIGGDENVVRSLSKELSEECQWAKGLGFRSGWGLAPQALSKPIERTLRHTPLRAWRNLVLIGCEFSELGD